MSAQQPILKKYKLTKDFNSPNVNPNPDGSATLRTKGFKLGDVVSGYVPKTRPEDNIVPIILVDSQWAIPVQFLIDPNASNSPVDKLKSDIDAVKNNTFAKSLADTAKTNMHAILVGAGIGLVVAWMMGKSKVFGGIIGAVAGAYIGKKMGKSETETAIPATKVEAKPVVDKTASSSANGKTNSQILNSK